MCVGVSGQIVEKAITYQGLECVSNSDRGPEGVKRARGDLLLLSEAENIYQWGWTGQEKIFSYPQLSPSSGRWPPLLQAPDGVIKMYFKKENINFWIYCKLIHTSFGAKKINGVLGPMAVAEQQEGDEMSTFHLEGYSLF